MIEKLVCLGFISLYSLNCDDFVMCNLKKRVIFTRGVLSIPTCDVYVRLETTSAAMKIARGTTNNQ